MAKIQVSKMKRSATAVFIFFCLYGCDKTDRVAEVGDESVTRQQYESYLKLKRIPLNDTAKYERQLVEYLKREAMAQAILEEGKLDQALIDAEVEEFRKQLVISRYFETYLDDQATDEGIQNFYAENEENFTSEKVHVAHILFRVRPDMEESERSAILTTAHEAYSKIRAGESFDEMAKTLSEDKVSAAKGGDLGWIKKGAVAPAFSDKAFALKKGEVSEPFLTPFGFHIVKVLDEKQLVKQPLEAVKGDIRYQLRNKAKAAEKERLLDKVSYKILEGEK